MFDATVLAAACSGCVDRLKKVLATHGHLIDVPDSHNWTPLAAAAQLGHVEAIKILIQSGSKAIDTPSNCGRTPICSAAQFGHLDVIETLVRLGCKQIDTPDINGNSPIYLAAQFGQVKSIEMLVRFGSRALETPNIYHSTPMQEMVNYGVKGPPVIRLLKALGLQAPPRLPSFMDVEISEDEVHQIRQRVYFADSLTDRLLLELLRMDPVVTTRLRRSE